ncbi:putative disease resistance protein RGA3 [Dichanthelium oligosanthes]|uniref:Putative disease resistance protein RGA3 n=1 Tax=Dichanthelium oligosanthes TaxID=888268 RepID=A0A1E5W112_9POAL|nr:putative disease resistance protein RGA3 [Dichanthelium oligosanthes]
MADVVGLLATAIVTQVGTKLGSAIGDQVTMFCCFKDDLEDMKEVLQSIAAVLKDAERRSIREQAVRLWLKRLKNVAFDISDMLDEFKADSKSADGKITGSLSCIAIAPKLSMANKMKKMREELKKINEARINFRFDNHPMIDNEYQLTDRETISKVNEAVIIGRNKERKEVIALLSGSNNKKGTVILPIFGLGGIGKTTLAQLVFNDTFFKDYDHRVWVYVSKVFDLKKIGNTIISQVLKEGRQHGENKEWIAQRVHDLLHDKKTLVILDDLWEINNYQLNDLKLMLDVGSKMKVLVTTRNEEVASRVCTNTTYRLSTLDNAMCWDIIRQNSNFESRTDKQQLEPIGRAIASKCGGVALAAQAIGFMLSRMELEQWTEVSNSDIWNESFSENMVLQSLMLTYISMPPHLRLCFAYCAIFPRGHSIAKYDLIHQWIALDFIEPSNTFSSRELGDMYVRQLLGMSFLQPSRITVLLPPVENMIGIQITNGDLAFLLFQTSHKHHGLTMHDLVHDVARSAMVEESMVFDEKKPSSTVDQKYCRYASLANYSKPLKISTILPAKLRALLFKDCSNLGLHGGSFSFAKYLRVLDLTESSVSDFPASIRQLKQLRFLVAPRMKNQRLPMSITELSKLQYLNLHGSHISALPKFFGKLEGLMHLDISDCSNLESLPQDLGSITKLQFLNLSGCSGIEELPESFLKLTNLMHLDMSSCHCLRPEALCGLTKLQYLNLSDGLNSFIYDGRPALVVDSDIREKLEYISNLINLEHLDLSKNRSFNSLPESFGNLKRLCTLDLSGCPFILSLPESIGSIDSLKFLLVNGCSEVLKQYVRQSQLRNNPLPHFAVHCNDSDSSSNLHQLKNINPSELEIGCLENVRLLREAKRMELCNKENLLMLTFHWTVTADRVLEDSDLLAELVPPSDLMILKLDGYSSISFPNWIMGISYYVPNLVSVWLRNLPRCSKLPPLGQLPNLEELHLENLDSITKIDKDLCGNNGAFRRLLKFTLTKMKRLEEWYTTYCAEDGIEEFMFPILDELYISGCPRLRMKPCPPIFIKWEITDSSQVLNSWEEPDKVRQSSSSPTTRLKVTLSSGGSWSLLYHLPTIRELEIFCCHLTSLPESMRRLTSLRTLDLTACSNLSALPEWFGELTSLESLSICMCPKIELLPPSIQLLTNLQKLTVLGCNKKIVEWCKSEWNKTLSHVKEIKCKCTSKVLRL